MRKNDLLSDEELKKVLPDEDTTIREIGPAFVFFAGILLVIAFAVSQRSTST